MFKENKGITLIALIVTIIVLLILAGVGLYVGSGSIKTARSNTKIAELEMVQHAILERYSEYKLTKNDILLIGELITSNEELLRLEDRVDQRLEGGDYYRLSPSDLEYLGISDTEDTYIVNYETGEAINETRAKTDLGESLYRNTK